MTIQNKQYIQLLITLRLRMLHEEGFERVTYDDLDTVFFGYVWKRNIPHNLSRIANTILNITADEIIRYLSLDASVSSRNMSLNDVLVED